MTKNKRKNSRTLETSKDIFVNIVLEFILICHFRYIEFIQSENVEIDVLTQAVDCSKASPKLPQELTKNCQDFDPEKFKTEPSIFAAFTNGRLGNQVCTDSTLESLLNV